METTKNPIDTANSKRVIMKDLATMLHDIECRGEPDDRACLVDCVDMDAECMFEDEKKYVNTWNLHIHNEFLMHATNLFNETDITKDELKKVLAAWKTVQEAREKLKDVIRKYQDQYWKLREI